MIRTCIWIAMIGLALIQTNNKIEFLLYEVMVYMLINFFVKKKIKKKKVKAKYKYQTAIEENIDYKKDESDEFNLDLFESQIDEIKNDLDEYENRVKSYDYREFEGRKNVPWEEIYDYLWLQCRYKGILMWIEYMRNLVKKGIMNEEDKKKVIKKAGNYIPWNPRIDVEAEHEDFRDEVRKKEKEYQNESEKNMKYIKKMYKEGRISKETYDDFINRQYKPTLEHLKHFYYEDYLKEIGKI